MMQEVMVLILGMMVGGFLVLVGIRVGINIGLGSTPSRGSKCTKAEEKAE